MQLAGMVSRKGKRMITLPDPVYSAEFQRPAFELHSATPTLFDRARDDISSTIFMLLCRPLQGLVSLREPSRPSGCPHKPLLVPVL